MARDPDIARISQSPADPAFVQDPYRFYAHALALGPLAIWDDYAMPVTTTHQAANAILRDRRFGRQVPAELAPDIPDRLAPFQAIEAHSMLELEPPRHTRLRSLVLRAFTSRRIAAMAPEIAALCARLIGAFPRGAFDLLPAYATPLPVIVIARLLGVPESMAPQLLAWSNAMVAMYQARRSRQIEDAAVAAAGEFADFMRGYVERRRTRPGDDLITHLIAAETEGETLSTDELIATCILLLNAGHEATVHSIGNGVKALLEAGCGGPDLVPGRIAGTVEEILRFDPPLQLFTRYAYEEAELFGHRFLRGDQVGCLLGAAGRDPGAYPDPARFDPQRSGPAQLAFGAGLHFCVGAPLARLELQIALPALFAALPNMRLTEPPVYANLYHFHGLEGLIVTN